MAIEQKPGGGWQRVHETQADEEAHWAAIEAMWEGVQFGSPLDATVVYILPDAVVAAR
jgi:hypothetical protein